MKEMMPMKSWFWKEMKPDKNLFKQNPIWKQVTLMRKDICNMIIFAWLWLHCCSNDKQLFFEVFLEIKYLHVDDLNMFFLILHFKFVLTNVQMTADIVYKMGVSRTQSTET